MSLHNPSLLNGPLQSQHTVLAVIVDNGISGKGPKDGSCLVRILGEHDNLATQQDQGGLQWVPVEVKGEAQSRTVGRFPGHQYQIGTKVRLSNVGPQGWIITGAMTNNQEDDARRDMHHNAVENSHTPWSDFGGPENHPYKRLIKGQPLYKLNPESIEALGVMNGTTPSTLTKGDGVEAAVKKTPTQQKYAKRIAPRLAEKEAKVGNEKFDGTENTTKFMQNLGAEEVVPNAQKMIEQLKQTAKGALNIPMVDSLGGLGNIMGAISGVLAMLQQIQKGTQEEDKQTLEEHLRQLYRELKKKEPLDIYGKETLDYRKWKKEYKLSLGIHDADTEVTFPSS